MCKGQRCCAVCCVLRPVAIPPTLVPNLHIQCALQALLLLQLLEDACSEHTAVCGGPLLRHPISEVATRSCAWPAHLQLGALLP